MNPYLSYIEGIEAGVTAAGTLSVSGRRVPITSASKVLLFSPHPDDECITGLLPLRLMRETGREVINIPVPFGSRIERQAGRAKELDDACAYLGWSSDHGAEGLDALEVGDVVGLIQKYDPDIIFVPHVKDWNSRHILTHVLVREALHVMPEAFSCTVVETEFWGAMDNPNLMVEADAELLADLVAATSLHVEEVARNPYHLNLPAWMQDNVRRGGELVGGQGNAAPEFSFATLYRMRKWEAGQWVSVLERGVSLPLGDHVLERWF